MSNAARLRFLSVVSGRRALLIAAIFLATAGAVFFVGFYFAPRYVATALLIGLPKSAQSLAGESIETSSTESTSNLISDEAILAIDKQLYPSLVTTLAPGWAVSQTRSSFSTESIAGPASGADTLRITFANHDQQTALRVTDALAAALTNSTNSSPRPVKHRVPAASVAPTVAPPEIQKPALTLSSLHSRLDQSAQRQTALQEQVSQQSAQLAAIQKERQHLAADAKQDVAQGRDRQLSKHNADEASLRAQLAAATRTMNDLGQRYTPDYPEYVNARDRVEELQNSLNQFLSKPFAYVLAPASDSSRRIAELDTQETAIKATLEILQQELDRNQVDARRTQAQLAHWSPGNPAGSKGTAAIQNPHAGTSAALSGYPVATPLSAGNAGYTILENATILSTDAPVNFLVLSLISLAFGLITASGAALLMRPPDKIIKEEADLENELPGRIQYLGGIPRIKHEIISR